MGQKQRSQTLIQTPFIMGFGCLFYPLLRPTDLRSSLSFALMASYALSQGQSREGERTGHLVLYYLLV